MPSAEQKLGALGGIFDLGDLGLGFGAEFADFRARPVSLDFAASTSFGFGKLLSPQFRAVTMPLTVRNCSERRRFSSPSCHAYSRRDLPASRCGFELFQQRSFVGAFLLELAFLVLRDAIETRLDEAEVADG